MISKVTAGGLLFVMWFFAFNYVVKLTPLPSSFPALTNLQELSLSLSKFWPSKRGSLFFLPRSILSFFSYTPFIKGKKESNAKTAKWLDYSQLQIFSSGHKHTTASFFPYKSLLRNWLKKMKRILVPLCVQCTSYRSRRREPYLKQDFP